MMMTLRMRRRIFGRGMSKGGGIIFRAGQKLDWDGVGLDWTEPLLRGLGRLAMIIMHSERLDEH